jgi:hypothetical protein
LWCRAPQCHSPSYTGGSGWTETRAERKGDACYGPHPSTASYLAEVVGSQSPGKPAHEKLQRVILLHGQAKDGLGGGLEIGGEHHTVSPRRTPIAHTPITRRTMLLGAAATAPAPATQRRGCNRILSCPVGRHCHRAAGAAVRPRRDGMHVRRGLGRDLAQSGGQGAAASQGGGSELERRAWDEGGGRREA